MIADGEIMHHGANAQKHAAEELDLQLDQLKEKPKMEDFLVLEEKDELPFVIRIAVPLIVNGVNLMNGEDAVKLAVREFKQERGKWYSGRNSGESYVQDILPNQDHATLKNVQLIVNGVTTVFGANAAQHVAEENSPEQGIYKDQQLTVERNALVMHQKPEIVPEITVQYPAFGMISEAGAHAARTAVVDGKGDLEPFNRRQLTEVYNVTDVQPKLELATPTIAQETVNGHPIQSGASALSHVMEEIKTEHEYCNKAH